MPDIYFHVTPLPLAPGSIIQHVIEAKDPVSSYRLLEVSQLGLVYTSTLGLEMQMFGMHCICAARAIYCGLGFTREPHSRDHYFAMIAEILADPEATKTTQREIELAWCFADLIMNMTGKPVPWTYNDSWTSILGDWPMERVLSPEGERAFGRTFALLAGDHDLPDGIVGDLDIMRET